MRLEGFGFLFCFLWMLMLSFLTGKIICQQSGGGRLHWGGSSSCLAVVPCWKASSCYVTSAR